MATTRVKGYTKSDGTRVKTHNRSSRSQRLKSLSRAANLYVKKEGDNLSAAQKEA